MSKQSYYYRELREMLAKPGCPICHVGRKVSQSQIKSLLYDSVTDRDSREGFAASLGFCSAHSRDLLAFQGERLGATIIEWAVLREAQRRLQRSTPTAKPGLRQRLRGQASGEPEGSSSQSCPICEHQAELEGRSLGTLLEHLVGDLDAPLKVAGGLCWPHLAWALRTNSDPAVHNALVDLHSSTWQVLIDRMAEFIRKRDYRFSHETVTDEETAAVERAICALTGEYPAL